MIKSYLLSFTQNEMLISTMQILEDISNSAESLHDLQTDLARDIYSSTMDIRLKMVKIVSAKSNLCKDIDSIPQYLNAIDYLD